MNPTPVTDAEVLSAMISFTEQGCDLAAQTWLSGKHACRGQTPEQNDADAREAYRRFRAIKSRAREIIAQYKRQRKEAAG